MPEIPVKVYVRVRPLLAKELLESNESCLHIVDSQQLVVGENRPFRFDRIFPQDSTQDQVYNESVCPLVGCCLDGYNVTVLAYGQTGSGKSYTMGSENSVHAFSLESRGIIPRALAELFEVVQMRKADFQYQVAVSYIEIYKEELRDLLCVEMREGPREMHIREDEQGNTVLVGCSEQVVENSDEALSWLGLGNSARITGATQMNEKSSRSHAIFTVHIRARKRDNLGSEMGDWIKSEENSVTSAIFSHFHFVDLAGSERASKTGNKGERFKALGNVISALGDGKKKPQHVPYRDSKITRLLKDSLGGNSETVLITCLSPSVYNFAEILNSLKYAKRARNIHNKPIVNCKPERSKLQQMTKEIILLKEELAMAKLEAGKMAIEKGDEGIMAQSEFGGEITEERTGKSGSDLQYQFSHASETIDVYSKCFKTVKDILVDLVHYQCGSSQGSEREKSGGLSGHDIRHMKRLASCLKILEACESLESSDQAELDQLLCEASSSVSHKAVTMSHLELEECQKKFNRDKLALVEEVAELKSTCQTLLEEKERVERLWKASQTSEAKMAEELFQMDRKVALLADQRINNEKEHMSASMENITCTDSGEDLKVNGEGRLANDVHLQEIKYGMDEDLDADRTSVLMEDSLEEEDEVEGTMLSSLDYRKMQLQKFEATRSLFSGKIQASTLSDFSKESILRSLHLLTHCVTVHRTQHFPPFSVLNQQKGSFSFLRLHEDEDLDTALVASQVEPSMSSRHDRNDLSFCGNESLLAGGKSEMELLNQSTVDFQHQLVEAEDELCHAHEELRCLTMKIRLKEQLIRELGKNSRHVQKQNDVYAKRIQDLEQEAAEVQDDMRAIQSALQSRGSDLSTTNNREKEEKIARKQFKEEQKKKLAQTQRRLLALQKRQKETQHLASYAMRSEKRIEELESGVERLRNHQELLRRKLKKEAEKKLKLEVDLQKYQHRIKTLQTRSEQQSKVLRVKTEEAAVAQRKLRSLGKKQLQPVKDSCNLRESQLMKKTAWLEDEINKHLREKEASTVLEKELEEREKVLEERERVIAERDELESKRVKSSIAISSQLESVSRNLCKVDSSLKQSREFLKNRDGPGDPRGKVAWKYGKEGMEHLIREREKLVKDQQELCAKLDDNIGLLCQEEQNLLVTLNEQIEVLDAAIEFRNHSIALRKEVMKKDSELSGFINSSDNSFVKDRLSLLSQEDLCLIFEQWFQKVLQLRLQEESGKHNMRVLEVELDMEREGRRKAELALHQAKLDAERLVTSQQLDHHKEMETLLKHTSSDKQDDYVMALEKSTTTLEKDLHYYKTTCQSLWMKLQRMSSSIEKTNVLHCGMFGSKFSGSMPELTLANHEVNECPGSREENVTKEILLNQQSLEGETEKRTIVIGETKSERSTAPRLTGKDVIGRFADSKRHHTKKGFVKKKKGTAVEGCCTNTVVEGGQKVRVNDSEAKQSPLLMAVDQEAFRQRPKVIKKSLSELRLLNAEDLAKRS